MVTMEIAKNMINLEGKTIGIIGYGSIGKEIAKTSQLIIYCIHVVGYTPV